MKKTLALLMSLILVLGVFSGVAFAEAAEIKPVKYVVPGDAPSGYDFAMEKINAELAEIGISLEIQYIPWDVWDQKLNLMLSTGEPFDMFHVMQDRVSMASYYGRGALMDITPYLEQYGENILKAIPENVMEGAKIDGKYYAIPANWVELGVEGYYTVRKDLLEKYNQPLPTTGAEMLDVLEAIFAEWDGAEMPYFTFTGAIMDPTSTHLTTLHSQYDRYPFTVRDSLVFVGQDGTIESWVETEEFKKDCEWMHEAYTRGLLDPDILSFTQDQLSDVIARGIYVFSFGTGNAWSEMVKEWPEITPEDVILARLNPEKGALRPYAFKNGNAIPSSSTNPEGAVKFLNWLYASQENYDLFLYGVEGVNFTIPEEGKMSPITLEPNDPQSWSFADWMIGNMDFIRTSTGGFPAIDNARYTTDVNAQNSIAGGFFFDPSPVQTEYSNVQTELAAAMLPIAMGVQSYEDYYEDALARLKAAGLDKVIEEYKAQFAAYQEIM